MSRFGPFGLRCLQSAFFLAALAALVMATLPTPPTLLQADKAQHMLAFFTLGILSAFAWRRINAFTLLAGLVAFGGLIELVQTIPELNRTADWADLAVDLIAAATAIGLARLIQAIFDPDPDADTDTG